MWGIPSGQLSTRCQTLSEIWQQWQRCGAYLLDNYLLAVKLFLRSGNSGKDVGHTFWKTIHSQSKSFWDLATVSKRGAYLLDNHLPAVEVFLRSGNSVKEGCLPSGQPSTCSRSLSEIWQQCQRGVPTFWTTIYLQSKSFWDLATVSKKCPYLLDNHLLTVKVFLRFGKSFKEGCLPSEQPSTRCQTFSEIWQQCQRSVPTFWTTIDSQSKSFWDLATVSKRGAYLLYNHLLAVKDFLRSGNSVREWCLPYGQPFPHCQNQPRSHPGQTFTGAAMHFESVIKITLERLYSNITSYY
jgi:hypothetical protein